MAVVANSKKRYLYITVILFALVFGSMFIFQNCTIAGGGNNEFSSSSCSDSGEIELFIVKNKQYENERESLSNILGHDLLNELVSSIEPSEETPYSENILGAADVVLTLSDAQDDADISWQIHYTPESGGQSNNLFDEAKKTQELEFSFTDPGTYKIVAQDHLAHDSCNDTYQKTVRIISDISSSLSYVCPQGSVTVQDQVEALPPSDASCPSGDAPYQLLLAMTNDFKTNCKIKSSFQLAKAPTKCETDSTTMSVSISDDTQDSCQSITFGVTALNMLHARKVYYKLSNQGFFVSQDSSWCTTDDNGTDPTEQQCYVHNTLGCYLNANSPILRRCKDRFTMTTVITSCESEFVNQCPSDLCNDDDDDDDEDDGSVFF